jgi:hypothetical protein
MREGLSGALPIFHREAGTEARPRFFLSGSRPKNYSNKGFTNFRRVVINRDLGFLTPRKRESG